MEDKNNNVPDISKTNPRHLQDKKENVQDESKTLLGNNQDKFIDKEKVPKHYKVSERTLTRKIREELLKLGLSWKADPKEVEKKTEKFRKVKKETFFSLTGVSFKWELRVSWLEELGFKRIEKKEKKPVLDKKEPVQDKPKEEITFADRIKEAFNRQRKILILRKEKEIAEKERDLVKEQNKKLEGKLSVKEREHLQLANSVGREQGKVELLLEANEDLKKELFLLRPGKEVKIEKNESNEEPQKEETQNSS